MLLKRTGIQRFIATLCSHRKSTETYVVRALLMWMILIAAPALAQRPLGPADATQLDHRGESGIGGVPWADFNVAAAQTFQVINSGQFRGIELWLGCLDNPDNSLTVKIQPVTPNGLPDDATVLASTTLLSPQIPVLGPEEGTPIFFDFGSANMQVVAGDKLAVIIAPAHNTNCGIFGSSFYLSRFDPYPDGELYNNWGYDDNLKVAFCGWCNQGGLFYENLYFRSFIQGTPPIITLTNPASGFQGSILPSFKVAGRNFTVGQTQDSGSVISFSDNGVFAQVERVLGSEIDASVYIAPDATIGFRKVIVTNPDGQHAEMPFWVFAPDDTVLPADVAARLETTTTLAVINQVFITVRADPSNRDLMEHQIADKAWNAIVDARNGFYGTGNEFAFLQNADLVTVSNADHFLQSYAIGTGNTLTENPLTAVLLGAIVDPVYNLCKAITQTLGKDCFATSTAPQSPSNFGFWGLAGALSAIAGNAPGTNNTPQVPVTEDTDTAIFVIDSGVAVPVDLDPAPAAGYIYRVLTGARFRSVMVPRTSIPNLSSVALTFGSTNVLLGPDQTYVFPEPVAQFTLQGLTGANTPFISTVSFAASGQKVVSETGFGITDRFPPVTVVTATPPANNQHWNNSPVSITFSSIDDTGGSGVETISYALTGAQTTSGTLPNPGTILLTNEGVTRLTYFATDNARNQESPHQQVFSIDTIPPSATAISTPAPNRNGWNNTPVKVSFVGIDALSGLVSCSAPTNLTNEGGSQIAAGDCSDVAGNASVPAVATVNIDLTPPVISGLPVPGCKLWPVDKKLVTVATVKAADTLSGVVTGSLKVSGSSNETLLPTDPRSPDIVITSTSTGGYTIQLRADRLGKGADRVYTLIATATDLAGNSATMTATCMVPHDQSKN